MLWMKGLAFMLLAGLPWIAMADKPASADAPPTPISENSADNTFDILEYAIEGNSVLSALQIEQAVYPHLGEKKTIQDVDKAKEALEKAYHAAGYLTVFVDIPEQDIKANVVRLAVTEGQVERLKVSGARYFSLGHIKSKTSELAEGSVPYFPQAQKQLATVSRTADRRVTPVLRPGNSPGKVQVELKVEDQLPLHGSVELNNRQSANTTETRLVGSLRYDNLWQREHSISLLYQTAPEKTEESQVFSLNYVIPRENGDYVALYGVKSNSDTAAVGDVSVIGQGRIFGLRYIRPLRSKSGFFHSLTAGWDYKQFDDTITLLGADSFKTPILYRPMLLGYEATWQGESRSTELGATFNFAIRGLGNREVQFSQKRSSARPSYGYMRLNFKHEEKYAGYSLAGRVSAQLAGAPLISNEQFSAGGADSVRGYLESEILGDAGFIGSLELRTPPFSRDPASLWNQTYALAFVEAAQLKVLEPLPEQTARFDISSSGLGLRMKVAKGFNVNLDVALPFKASAYTRAHDPRLHAKLSYEF